MLNFYDVPFFLYFRYGGAAAQSAGAQSLQSSQSLGSRQGQVSSALQKATALTGKIQQKAATRKVTALESDSDESFNLQMVKSIGDMVCNLVLTHQC